MDNQERYDNRIRHALDARLSGIVEKPDSQQRVLRHVRGEMVMKKKISLGLVLVIVLVLAVMTALAAMTLNAYYEKTIEKEGESGQIRNWSAADKVALVDWMVEAGIELDSDKVAKLHGESLPETEKDALAMEIIEGYYPARDGILSTVDIIAKEKGPIEYWSLEDRVWFSDMLAKYQPDEVKLGRNLLPGESDITQEQAEGILFKYYKDHYNLDRDDFDTETQTVWFGESTFDDGSGPRKLRHWTFNIYIKGNPENVGAYIGADGQILGAAAPQSTERTWNDDWYDTSMADDFWTIEGMYKFKQEWGPRVEQLLADGEEVNSEDLLYLLKKNYGLPQEGDITRDDALKIAQKAVLEMPGWTEEELDCFGTREAYRTDNLDRPVYYFAFTYWTNALTDQQREKAQTLHVAGEIPLKVIVQIDAKTGAVVEAREDNSAKGTDRLGM